MQKNVGALLERGEHLNELEGRAGEDTVSEYFPTIRSAL